MCMLWSGLAVSDALFCLAVLPRAYIGAAAFGFRRFDVRVVYTAYGDALVNTFIVSSTWLTVAMAVSRYVAICRPRIFLLRMRETAILPLPSDVSIVFLDHDFL